MNRVVQSSNELLPVVDAIKRVEETVCSISLPHFVDYEIYSVQWEYEDKLPDVSDLDYQLMFEYSAVRDGVRMFPYLEVYSNETGESKRLYLGA